MDIFIKLSLDEQKELLKIVINDLTEETIIYPENIKDQLIKKINEIVDNKVILCGRDGPIKKGGRCCKNKQDTKGRFFNFYDDGEILIDDKGYCWSKDDLNEYTGTNHPYEQDVSFDQTYLEWSQRPVQLKMMANRKKESN